MQVSLEQEPSETNMRCCLQVTVLHGRLTKLERANVMEAFLRGTFRAMVVSDAFSRGLDIPDCDAVFNLELPFDAVGGAHGNTHRHWVMDACEDTLSVGTVWHHCTLRKASMTGDTTGMRQWA